MKGTIKFYDKKKGYGFITSSEDDRDYFLHISQLLPGKKPFTGDKVSFVPKETEKGLQAREVSFVE